MTTPEKRLMPCVYVFGFPCFPTYYTIMLLRLDPVRSLAAAPMASSAVVENLRDAVDRRPLVLVVVVSETSLTCGDELVNS